MIEEKRIVDLLLNRRNFLDLRVLQAGVAASVPAIDAIGSGTNKTPGGTEFNFSVNGIRITSNNHLLDGVNNVEPITGAAMVVALPDTIQEFRILTNMYSADRSRSGPASSGRSRTVEVAAPQPLVGRSTRIRFPSPGRAWGRRRVVFWRS